MIKATKPGWWISSSVFYLILKIPQTRNSASKIYEFTWKNAGKVGIYEWHMALTRSNVKYLVFDRKDIYILKAWQNNCTLMTNKNCSRNTTIHNLLLWKQNFGFFSVFDEFLLYFLNIVNYLFTRLANQTIFCIKYIFIKILDTYNRKTTFLG